MTTIVTSTGKISNLVSVARQRADHVRVIVVGDARICGVDSVVRVPLAPTQPVEALAPAVAQLVDAGELVLVADTPADRVLGAAVAARHDAPILMGLSALTDDGAQLSRFGGLSDQTVTIAAGAVAVLDGGEMIDGEQVAQTLAEPSGAHDAAIASIDAVESTTVNLSAAERIVCAGRGFRDQGDLDLANKLAAALGAEVGVTRPLAEGYNWMPRESYIGVSGQIVAPKLYVAVGLSGQIHHTAGMADSDVIIAINDDELATIFEFADYGIVGDLYEVLPALTDALTA